METPQSLFDQWWATDQEIDLSLRTIRQALAQYRMEPAISEPLLRMVGLLACKAYGQGGCDAIQQMLAKGAV